MILFSYPELYSQLHKNNLLLSYFGPSIPDVYRYQIPTSKDGPALKEIKYLLWP